MTRPDIIAEAIRYTLEHKGATYNQLWWHLREIGAFDEQIGLAIDEAVRFGKLSETQPSRPGVGPRYEVTH